MQRWGNRGVEPGAVPGAEPGALSILLIPFIQSNLPRDFSFQRLAIVQRAKPHTWKAFS